ncbi:MAG: hypothetical protein Q8Q05_00490 [bacterium]|nr:hypothetical protein [bacterium]
MAIVVIRLLEPEMCSKCRFASMAEVEATNGIVQHMIYCRRGDCDNWVLHSAEPARLIRHDGEGGSDSN